MGRAPCCSKEGLNRGAWTALEDKILVDYISAHGEGKWRNIPKFSGLKRCGKSCRLRWLNYLRPEIKRGNILPEEEDLIIRLHKLLGNRWSLIAGRIPGRTDNEIKNYWNTTLRKKVKADESKTSTQATKKSTKPRMKTLINPVESNVAQTKASLWAPRAPPTAPTSLNPLESKLGHWSPSVNSSEEGQLDELPELSMDFSLSELLASDFSDSGLWKLLDGGIEQQPLLFSDELLNNCPVANRGGYFQLHA